jgi:hypothetical protein
MASDARCLSANDALSVNKGLLPRVALRQLSAVAVHEATS